MNSVVEFIAPYRFVRPAARIFYPSWGNQRGEDISFDMPYADSQSGEIDIIIEAKSPIFVGNGKDKGQDSNAPQPFCQHDGIFYIPGSSVRGMIRTIASILSFSKISIDTQARISKSNKGKPNEGANKTFFDIYKSQVENYNENLLDCVERIFGFVKRERVLKGRVSFSHFKVEGEARELKAQSLILSSPRATFYPYYLQQLSRPLKTYDDKSARISGFKFYVPKQQIAKSADNPNEKIKSRIKPLAEGTKFKGKLRYFNLRHEELGLMLLSLSFLRKQDLSQEHFYKLGGAKPYGYGDCHITLDTKLDIQAYIQSFIDFVQKELGENPQTSASAADLLEVSKKWSDDELLEYMELQGFRQVKKDPSSKGNSGRPHYKNHKPNQNAGNKGHRRDHGEKSYTDKNSSSFGNNMRVRKR